VPLKAAPREARPAIGVQRALQEAEYPRKVTRHVRWRALARLCAKRKGLWGWRTLPRWFARYACNENQ